MWTINVPAGNSSSGIIPSPHSPLLCCASDRPNRASTPISSTLMPAFRFLDDVRTHYETEIVDIPQVFLPCASYAKGLTLDEKMMEGTLLLGGGKSEPCTLIASCNYV